MHYVNVIRLYLIFLFSTLFVSYSSRHQHYLNPSLSISNCLSLVLFLYHYSYLLLFDFDRFERTGCFKRWFIKLDSTFKVPIVHVNKYLQMYPFPYSFILFYFYYFFNIRIIKHYYRTFLLRFSKLFHHESFVWLNLNLFSQLQTYLLLFKYDFYFKWNLINNKKEFFFSILQIKPNIHHLIDFVI